MNSRKQSSFNKHMQAKVINKMLNRNHGFIRSNLCLQEPKIYQGRQGMNVETYGMSQSSSKSKKWSLIIVWC